MANENGQASVVGTGWDLPIPFIERKFSDCDGGNVGSKCWAGENAVISLGGQTSNLIQVGTEDVRADGTYTQFAMESEQGYRVERVYGGAGNDNGDGIGFYWKVTAADGTQYFFGRENTSWQTQANNSTLTMPVVSAQPDDPCYDTANDWPGVCTMAWRWNLAYVVDPNANIQTYQWGKAIYTYEPWPGVYWDYDGDSLLLQLGYGRRTADVLSGPAQRIEFAYRWRCDVLASGLPAGQCDDQNLPDMAHPEWYPDIPFDIACWAFNGSNWCDNGPPDHVVFYGLRRLDAVFTQVATGAGNYAPVDTYYMTGTYKTVGTDYSTSSLVINDVWRVGSDDTSETPRTSFGYQMDLANRWAGGDIASSAKPRLNEVLTDLGARVRPAYSQPDPCSSAQNVLGEATQASDCFMVYRSDGTHDHYKKYLVSQVQVLDRDGSPAQTTTYSYSVNTNPSGIAPAGQGAGWHSDNQITVPLDKQGWTQFRGYQSVTVSQNRASGAPAKDVTTFFRGLHGDHVDRANTAATKSASVATAPCPTGTPASATNTCNRVTTDADALHGKVYEHRILNGAGVEQSDGQHDYAVTTTPLAGAPAETRPWGVDTHPILRLGESVTTSLVYDTGTPRNRKRVVTRGFDATYARQVWQSDSGDSTTGIGPSCTWTTWNTNTTNWVLQAARRSVTATGACGASEPTGSALIGRTEFLYDGLASGSVDAGNLTERLDYTGPNGNVTAPNQFAATQYTYDAYGHQTGVLAPDNYSMPAPKKWATTAYGYTAGALTSATATNELGHVTTTTFNAGRGVPVTVTDANNRVTTLGYDTFGRLTSVLRPGDTAGKPTTTYAYAVNQWAPSVITTTQYSSPTATGITSYAYLDSLGRTFQSEVPGPTAGQRILTGTQYDDQGNPGIQVNEFVPSPAGTPGTPVPNFYDAAFTNSLPSRSQTTYDELDRPTAVAVKSGATTISTATTSYDGLTATATPASNGTNGPALYPTATTKDLYGRTVKSTIKRGTPSDIVTSYTYDVSGNLKTITSPKGAVTTYTYDWAGRATQTVDPDAGTSTATYFPGGQVSYAKDGAGKEIWTDLDLLGRPTVTWTGPSTAKVKTVQNTYDTALKGTLASATRWDGANAFTEATTYDTRYRAASVTRSVPGALLGGTGTQSWTTSMTYDQLDRPLTLTYPAAGGLVTEQLTTSYSTQGYLYRLGTNLAGAPWYVENTVFDNIGQMTFRSRGNWAAAASMQQNFGYDSATGRLTSVAGASPSGATTNNVQNQAFTYANTGEVTAITNVVDNQRECFTYDGLSRLTLAGTTSNTATGCAPDMTTGPTPYKEAYSYDDDGSLTQLVRSSSPTVAKTYNYTYGNTTLGTTALTGGPHALTVVKDGTTAINGYSYDAAGRQTSKTNGSGTSPVASTWNSLGQLATVAGTANAFTYGPDGDRWVRKAVAGGTTTTTVYLPGQEVARAVTSAGVATTTAVRYYAHGSELIATRSTGTGLAWVVGNYQSSNTTAVNAATGAITRDRYTPYGLNRANSANTAFTLPGATGSDRGWLGQTRDDGTGLDYLNARYYDPTTAHFISPDPLNNQEVPQAANPYTYGDDNPTTLSDPTGLMTIGGGGGSGNTYTVKAGQNWNTIAQISGLSLSQLRSLNGGSLGALRVGQVVNVIAPIKATPAAAKAAPKPNSSFAKGFLDGAVDSTTQFANSLNPTTIVDKLKKVFTQNPWSLVKSLAKSITHYDELKAIYDNCKNGATYSCGKAVGAFVTSAAIDVAATVLGTQLAKAAINGIQAAKAAKVVGASSKVESGVAAAVKACSINSFTGNTLILMGDGITRTPIKDVALNDEVWARDPQTGEAGPRPVTDLIRHSGLHSLVQIRLEDGTKLQATDRHPFWVSSGERWVDAIDLRKGELLTTTSGSIRIEDVLVQELDITAYNLTVDDLHTYFVGESSVLVHNAACRTFGLSNAPKVGGVYIIMFKDGSAYVGSSLSNIHGRLHAAFTDPTHAVRAAGNSVDDIAGIAVKDMSGYSNAAILAQEQATIDSLGGIGSGKLLNRINAVKQ